MTIDFYKYQGTGNDFIIIDCRKSDIDLNTQQIAFLCDRKFGIGADGLMLYKEDAKHDFSMVYFNSNGELGSMCGNGGRCIVAFSHYIGNKNSLIQFNAVDGYHEAEVLESDNQVSLVKLKMGEEPDYKISKEHIDVNTGSPHYVQFTQNLEQKNVFEEGKHIRYSAQYPLGTNVNFVEIQQDQLFVRTYERGVENETLSCGTGSTASAIAYSLHTKNEHQKQAYKVLCLGGELKVEFAYHKGAFSDIWLSGPATQVFKGKINF